MDDYDLPLPQAIPPGAFVGFQTASKKALPPPSASALARAQRMLDEDVEPPKKRARPSVEGGSQAAMNTEGMDTHSQLALSSPASPVKRPSDHGVPRTVGFATAGGKAVPPPSRDAQRAVAGLWDLPASVPSAFETASGQQGAPPSREAQERVAALLDTPSRPSGFATASGKYVAAPSKEAQALVQGILSDHAPSPPATSGFATASGRSVAPPSQAARSHVANLFAKPSPALPTAGSTPPAAMQTPSRPSGFASASGKAAVPVSKATREAAMAIFGESSTSTPFRSPLQPKTPVANIGSPSLRGKSISITPSTQRRSGVGLMAPRGKSKNSFVSPFKRNVPSAAPPRAPAAASPVIQVHRPIFDLQGRLFDEQS